MIIRRFLILLFSLTNHHLIYGEHTNSTITIYTLADLWAERRVRGAHLFPTKLSATYPEFVAIPRVGDGVVAMVHFGRHELLKKIGEIQERNGVLIHSICSYKHLNTTFFTINTMYGVGKNEFLIDANMSQIEQKMALMTERRVKINYICVGADQDSYSAIWHHSNDFVWHFIVESGPIMEIIERDKIQMSRGYFTDCFQAYRSANESRAIVIWRKSFGRPYKIQYGTNLEAMLSEMESSGLKPAGYATLPSRNGKRGKPAKWIVWHGDEFTWNGKEIPINRSGNFSWTSLENSIIHRMRSYDIPSISINIFRDGTQLYSTAFGFADILQNIQATTKHRYRIASISKIITAMGVSELLTKYRLDPLTPVFGKNGILWELCDPCHPYLHHIRIMHLLEHSSGAWPHTRKSEFDRMEQNQTEFLSGVIRENFPVEFPGHRHIYSNIGFILLGVIIEKISGENYEQFIRNVLLDPLGINATIGKEGDPNVEVTYYSHDNANAYTSWNTSRLNSAAGWAMTAEDVTKIFYHLERNKVRKYRWIITPSMVRWNYGRGIQLGADGSIYHIGSLAGTEAIGYSWKNIQVAILSNIRGKEQNEQTGWMENLCRNIVDGRFFG